MEQMNPFTREKSRYAYLVYRSKYLSDEREQKGDYNDSSRGRWRTFGYYDSLVIDDKVERIGTEECSNITYKDCFAIRYPPAFRGHSLVAKQVFTLIPFPEQGTTINSVLRIPKEQKLPFLGMIMVSINLVQDEAGEEGFEKGDPEGYLHKLRYYAEWITFMLEEHRTSASLPEKNELSESCQFELFLSSNCADLCVVIRTARMEDIYLSTKLIRIHLSLKELPEGDLHFSPGISTIVAMSTDVEEYDLSENSNFCRINSGMAVDFRLSCNSGPAEEALLNCCDALNRDTERVDDSGILPGERIGGVLGVGHYSIYMSLLEFLYLVFVKTEDAGAFLLEPNKKRSALMSCICQNSKDCGLFQMKDYTISNVRLRFCNNKGLILFAEEKKCEQEWLEQKKMKPRTLVRSGWYQIDELLLQMRRELSLYRNRVHYSAYMLKESLSMMNDLYYTYNDLLYSGGIHSCVLATQLFALSGNVLQYLEEIAQAVKEVHNDSMGRNADEHFCIDAIDRLVEMINQVVLSINAYNKSLVAFSQPNLNYPNYEIQSKVNIEKYQVAYSAFVQSLCDVFPHDEDQKHILAYVYLNISEQDTQARQCFSLPAFPDSKERKRDDGLVTILAIASPNYRRFAHMHHLLPQLCHELGHHFRILDRAERNKIVFLSMLEPAAKQLAELAISQSALPEQNSYSDSIIEAMTEQIREALWREFCHTQGNGKQLSLWNDQIQCRGDKQTQGMEIDNIELSNWRFSELELPILSYLFENLNYEESSFSRFWRGYKALLQQAILVSRGKLRVCGDDLALQDKKHWTYEFNVALSALNYNLVEKLHFDTGSVREAVELRKHEDLLALGKEDNLGWQKAVKSVSMMEGEKELKANVLLMLCMHISCGICFAYANTNTVNLHVDGIDESYQKANDKFKKYFTKTVEALSYYTGGTMKQIPTFEQQMVLIEKAQCRCRDMYSSSLDMLRKARELVDSERHNLKYGALQNYAERCIRLCKGVRDVIYTLRGIFNKRNLARTDANKPTGTDKIPFVLDNRSKRTEFIIDGLQTILAKSEYYEESSLADSMVSWFQDTDNCRKALNYAFQQVNIEQCQIEAHDNYNSYNEICADLAMCAAMRFTPFGYLTYTEHIYTEHPEQNGDYPFTTARISKVTKILLLAQFSENMEDVTVQQYRKAVDELEGRVSNYKVHIQGALTELCMRTEKVISGLSSQEAYSKLFESVYSELHKLKLYLKTMEQRTKLWRYEALAEMCIWQVDELAQTIRPISHALGQMQEATEKQVQELVDSITDVLAHLRTMRRIGSALLFIREPDEPEREEPEESRKQEPTKEVKELDELEKHYFKLWRDLNRKGGNRNKWIQQCRTNETLESVSRHYNEYDTRPGKDRTDEFWEQVHFILRYYWEGNLRYRCMKGKNVPWAEGDAQAAIQEWFKRWKKCGCAHKE